MIYILLSHERSGSHLMGDYVSACGVGVIDEVCNVNAVDPLRDERSFARYKYEYSLRDKEAFLKPTFSDHTRFISGYFGFLAGLKPHSSIMVDIKYGHVHQFEPFWSPIFKRPAIFDILDPDKIRLIHLYRSNVVEAAVSAWIADKTRVWHSWQKDANSRNVKTYSVDVQKIVQNALLLLKQSSFIRDEWCSDIDTLQVRYEDLSAALAGESATFERLENFGVGRSSEKWQPKLKKLGRPLHQDIENYNDLAAACEAAGLGHFLRQGQ